MPTNREILQRLMRDAASVPTVPDFEIHPVIANTLVSLWMDRAGVGHPNYQCTLCHWSSLEEGRMKEHQFHGDHFWPWAGGIHPYLKDKLDNKEEVE
jgi:hypothetical protein